MRLRQVLRYQRSSILRDEGRSSRDHFDGDDPETVDVRSMIDPLAGALLGTHVTERPHERARARNRRSVGLHGFRDAAHYYQEASALFSLHHIRVPTLLISAEDDPFVDPAVLPEVRAIARDNPALTCAFPRQGGHVGFVPKEQPFAPISYAEERAVRFLHEHAAHVRGR